MEKKLIKRFLEDIAFSGVYSRQMRFITGPRQSGKTTIALNKLKASGNTKFYYNWDRKEVRGRYRKIGDFLALDTAGKRKPWVCFDEIHKFPKWKNILKDFFDTHEKKVNFTVTGSARLDAMRKAGDSLAGRYFVFKLNPFMLAEICGGKKERVMPGKKAGDMIMKNISVGRDEKDKMHSMLELSGFPEPLIRGSRVFASKWQDDYFERIVKEDLRDISAIHYLEKVLDLIYLLPDKIGSPLSINSLQEDLETGFHTVKNYINYLNLTYVLFRLSPYSKKISRAVKKEKKVYFYNYSVISDEAARFENYVALELKARVDLWNDSAPDRFDIFFIRTRGGRETDFLITKNKNPYILFEAKLSSKNIDSHHIHNSEVLGNIPFVQLVKKPGVVKVKKKREGHSR